MKPLDIGDRIRRKVEEQHWNYSDFARAINCSRSSLYHIFNSRDISVCRLIEISRVLNHDFIAEICSDNLMSYDDKPFLVIPFTHKEIDLSGLPQHIIDMIRCQLDK